jgi:hypothetical protein
MGDDLKTLLHQAVAEMRRHFDVSNEALRGDVRGVAEAVTTLDAKFDRELTSVRSEMREGFSETQSMFKFSHAELDRRIRELEEHQRGLERGLSELNERVVRLESEPH